MNPSNVTPQETPPRVPSVRAPGFRLTALLAMVVLLMALLIPAFAQRGSFGRSGGFGGGRSSFGSGGFGRSSGSFGRSSGGFFGGSSRSSSSTKTYGGPSTSTRSGSGSFGRSGSFGNSGRINSTSLGDKFSPPPSFRDIPYSTRTNINYGGSSVPAFGYGFLGGYSLGMLSNPWSHWNPLSPAFYVNPPTYYNGAMYAGGFSFFRFILGLVIIGGIFMLVRRLFRGGGGGGNGGGFGGGRRIKYTVYK